MQKQVRGAGAGGRSRVLAASLAMHNPIAASSVHCPRFNSNRLFSLVYFMVAAVKPCASPLPSSSNGVSTTSRNSNGAPIASCESDASKTLKSDESYDCVPGVRACVRACVR